MPKPTNPDASSDLAEVSTRSRADILRAALVDAVLAVPGVARLEPTLSTTGPGMLLHRSPTDGVRTLDRAGAVDVDVDIATLATHQARAVTHQVQTSIVAVLTAHGRTPGPVTVSVLTINPR